jgi:hypothetical protein
MDVTQETRVADLRHGSALDTISRVEIQNATKFSKAEPQLTNNSVTLPEADVYGKLPARDDSAWLDLPVGYQWPASRLTETNRQALVRLSKTLKRPMNQVLKEAVQFYADAMLTGVQNSGAEQQRADHNTEAI